MVDAEQRDAPVVIMDTKDPEADTLQGHAAVGLEARGQRKLPGLLFAHSVLTCACAALCIYAIYKVHRMEDTWPKTPPLVDKGIYLRMLKAGSNSSHYLNFTVTWSNSLKLEHGSEVIVPLAGPYVFYICVHVQGSGTKGNLTLKQGQTEFSFELIAQQRKKCVRHQKVISLYEKEKVSFSFINTVEPYLWLDDLRVGLHYLLGAQENDTPEYD